MKKIYALIIAAVVLTSCGENKEQTIESILESKDLTQIRAKKSELTEKQQTLNNQIKALNEAIAKLDDNKKIPLITILKAEEKNFIHYLELQGNVQTTQNILISPELNGILNRILVKKGQVVKKGQALASIKDSGLFNQLEQLKAQLDLAKTTYERQERLWKQKVGSEIQFLQVKTNYEAQKNAVSQMEKTIAKLYIRAPFSGVIDDILIDQGNLVAPGMGVFRIVNLSNMYIETVVPEAHIKTITKGKSVVVEFPVLGEFIQSSVAQVGNFVNPANRTFKIEVNVPNKKGNIKPNLTAKLKINDYTNPKAILIPQNIISENSKGEEYVFVVDQLNKDKGIAKQVIIKTGKVQDGLIEVKSGISKDDQIIMDGARSVIEGQQVQVLR